MVVFACNHCGESCKKQAVEKHYAFKCRGAPIFVSCMDCQKDFRGQEFDAHIKCITELEKYSGKDYVAKANQNKGEKKQQAWMDKVRNIASTRNDLSSSIKDALLKLSQYENIPRKQVKFKNFVKNSFRGLRYGEDDIVWTLLDEEWKKEVAATAAEKLSIAAAKKEETENSEVSKKRKHDEDDDEESNKKVKVEDAEEEEENTIKFSWEDSIFEIMNKKKETTLDRLKKKVYKKYLAFSNKVEVAAKTEKKFLKKLKKMNNLSVDNDNVRLVAY